MQLCIQEREIRNSKRFLKSEHSSSIKMPWKRNKRKSTPVKRTLAEEILEEVSIIIGKVDLPETSQEVHIKPERKKDLSRLAARRVRAGLIVDTPDEPKDREKVVRKTFQDVTVKICGPLCPHVSCSYSQGSRSKIKPSKIYSESKPDALEETVESKKPSPKKIYYGRGKRNLKRVLKSEHCTGIKMPSERNKRKRVPTKKMNAYLKEKVKEEDSDKLDLPKIFKKVGMKSQLSKDIDRQVRVHGGFMFDTPAEQKDEKTVVEEIIQDVTVEICGPLCPHTSCSRSIQVVPHTSCSPESTSRKEPSETYSKPEPDPWPFAIQTDHSYFYRRYTNTEGIEYDDEETDSDIEELPDNRVASTCKLSLEMKRSLMSAPYPIIWDCSDTASVEVVSLSPLFYSNYFQKAIAENNLVQERKRLSKHTVTASVLECLENKDVPTFLGQSSTSYSSEHSNEENAENLEDVDEKELAIRHINNLKSKNKKQFQGPLACQLCKKPKTYTAMATLIHHYRSHAGIKPFTCELCKATFTRRHSLNYHQKIHENKYVYTCKTCDRPFRHNSHYKEHLRRHTGETPFKCTLCTSEYKTRNTYKRHLEMRHQKRLTVDGIEDITSDS